jgi:hypothetical protein
MSSVLPTNNEFMRYVDDEAANSGIILITKPEQSGKTFTMLKEITKFYLDPENNNFTNFIFCGNNLLLVKQTSARVNNEIKTLIDSEGTPYIEFSSHDRTEHNNYKSVFHAIVAENIKNVLCCCNGTRVQDACKIIEDFNKNSLFKDYKFNIWLDEADIFITFIDDFIKLKRKCENVNINIYCLTATPEPLFKKYKVLNVYPIEEPVNSNYHGWNDNIKKIYDVKYTDPLSFVNYLMNLPADEEDNQNHFLKCVKRGSKWFIPARNTKESHNQMAELLSTIGFVTLIINGNGICIYYGEDDKRNLFLQKNDELDDMLVNIYKKFDLHLYPVCITGNICIGRGVTVMSSEFMINYAVFSDYGYSDEQSQMAGRTKGNIKNLTNYKTPNVFACKKFDKNAIEKEEQARKIAKLAFVKYENEIGLITFSEFKNCNKDYEYVKHPISFETYDLAINFLRSVKEEMRVRSIQPNKKMVMHSVEEGYIVTSKLLKQGKTVADLTKEDIITLIKLNDIPLGRSISSTNKGSRYLIIPYYEDENSPPESVRFQVRYLKYKE